MYCHLKPEMGLAVVVALFGLSCSYILCICVCKGH